MPENINVYIPLKKQVGLLKRIISMIWCECLRDLAINETNEAKCTGTEIGLWVMSVTKANMFSNNRLKRVVKRNKALFRNIIKYFPLLKVTFPHDAQQQ